MVYTAATTVPFSLGTTKDSTYLCYLPVFWVAGEVFGVIFPIFAGCTCVLLNRWDPVAAMAAIDRYKVTHASFLVDGAVEILDHPDRSRYDLTSLERTGGISFVKKLNPDLRQRWRAVTGSTIREVAWGMTETHTCDTMNYGLDADDFDLNSQPVFVGFPVPGTEFKICDFESGALKALGEEGEICIRSPSLFKGYWNRPDTNAEVFRNGWFHTRRHRRLRRGRHPAFPGAPQGDAEGQWDERLPRRARGDPRPVSGHPRLRRHRRPDEAKGEVPVAFVWLPEEQRDGAGREAFRAWVETMMSSYKRPELRFVDGLPMTETGKVKKEQLKALL